jgi:hypothetical protein
MPTIFKMNHYLPGVPEELKTLPSRLCLQESVEQVTYENNAGGDYSDKDADQLQFEHTAHDPIDSIKHLGYIFI